MLYTKDVVQEAEGNKEIPEIRVWVHPHKVGQAGSDTYLAFQTIQEAEEYIRTNEAAERYPLLAVNGKEFDLYHDDKPKESENE